MKVCNKFEAINDVLFAQKICEVYYKDYRRGDMNFFGVLKSILKPCLCNAEILITCKLFKAEF